MSKKDARISAVWVTPAREVLLGLVVVLLAGCVNSPLPAGTEASLYSWDDRDNPIATRVAMSDERYNGFFTGDFWFGGLAREVPASQLPPDLPLVLKSCVDSACYYAVVFPGDYTLSPRGHLRGYASLTGLSTALYHQVAALPAVDVRPRLDELAVMLLKDTAGARDYAALLGLDIRRLEEDREMLVDPALADSASRLVAAGGSPRIMELVNGDATRTSELSASRDFLFSASWTLSVDVDVSGKLDGAGYLSLCRLTATSGGDAGVYDDCLLKTPLVAGRYAGEVRMTGVNDSLLITVIDLVGPRVVRREQWTRQGSNDALSLR